MIGQAIKSFGSAVAGHSIWGTLGSRAGSALTYGKNLAGATGGLGLAAVKAGGSGIGGGARAAWGGVKDSKRLAEIGGNLASVGISAAKGAGGAVASQWRASGPLGHRSFAMYGAVAGAMANDENRILGAITGAGLGARARGAFGIVKAYPITAMTALGSAGVVAGASVEAYQAVRSQRANYDLNATGAVPLGLHALRHG